MVSACDDILKTLGWSKCRSLPNRLVELRFMRGSDNHLVLIDIRELVSTLLIVKWNGLFSQTMYQSMFFLP